MGWGLYLKDVYISRVTLSQVDDLIVETEENLEMLRADLVAMAAMTPERVEEENTSTRVSRDVLTLLKEYDDNVLLLSHLIFARDNPNDVIEDI